MMIDARIKGTALYFEQSDFTIRRVCDSERVATVNPSIDDAVALALLMSASGQFAMAADTWKQKAEWLRMDINSTDSRLESMMESCSCGVTNDEA